MKNLNKILLLGLVFVGLWGCKKVEDIVSINPNAKLTASLSANTLTLLKDDAAKDALTVTWVKPDYGFNAAPIYSVYIDKKGNNFAKPVILSVGSELKKVIKTSDLNGYLLAFGFPAGTAADLDIKVESLLGTATVLTSPIVALKATPYSEKLDLSTTWGVVGSATPGGWNGPDLPFYKSVDVIGELVAYVSLIDGEIKFRENNKWDNNLGGSAGTLTKDGPNIAVNKGNYKITFNPTAKTYKIDAFSWGIVGSATPNSWNGPDIVMEYDATIDLFRADATLVDGEMKFRQNNDWGNNLGGSNGTLTKDGANIAVKKGRYLITLDPKKLKYTISAYSPWGLVGDATPNSWNDPDIPFTFDLSTEKWVLNNVVVKAGQIKFRQNNDWTNNFGSVNSNEPDPIAASGGLKAGGKNFGVAAGTWSFELDLKDTNNPKYKAIKIN